MVYIVNWKGLLAEVTPDGNIDALIGATGELSRLLAQPITVWEEGDALATLEPGDDGHVLAVLTRLPGAVVTQHA